jgi:hypothetical protein
MTTHLRSIGVRSREVAVLGDSSGGSDAPPTPREGQPTDDDHAALREKVRQKSEASETSIGLKGGGK